MEALPIVQQLRDLAKKPGNRVTIVKDRGCLPGLVLFLDNDSQEVVGCAVEAMLYLAQEPSNCELMFNELGLVISLNQVVAKAATPPAVRDNAKHVLETITPAPASPAHGANERVPLSATKTPGQSFFRGNMNKKARTITLQIANMNTSDDRKVVEEQLLSIKGVVSFTFDMKTCRVVIRARNEVTLERLCGVIADTKTMRASQVVKNDNGQEIFLSFGEEPMHTQQKENIPAAAAKVPEYLDEVEEEEDPSAFRKAVARVGDGAKNAGGWLSSTVGYITKNLYW